jgi:threonine dehydrogenase-like Zn-dependent dehydrogenase
MHYVAEQIATGALAPTRAVTQRFRWDELEQVYERLLTGARDMVGVTLHWD